MTRMIRVAVAATAFMALLIGATPVAASTGAQFGACVARHATTEGGFTNDHNPGIHAGFAGWPGCPS